MKCETCRFWDRGLCRAQPPNGGWPTTQPDDWCGAYKSQQKQTRTLKTTPTDADRACAERLAEIFRVNMGRESRSWADTVRLMRTIDQRTHAQIEGLAVWASEHAFWHQNVLSPAKLRKQWTQLERQRAAENSTTPTGMAAGWQQEFGD